MPLANAWEVASGSFGIAAAVLLVGGAILLRYQRDRHHFLLAKAALEKGVALMPNGLPAWMASMRQGILAAVLGIGLLASGGALGVASHMLPETPSATMEPNMPPPGNEPRAGPVAGRGNGPVGEDRPEPHTRTAWRAQRGLGTLAFHATPANRRSDHRLCGRCGIASRNRAHGSGSCGTEIL